MHWFAAMGIMSRGCDIDVELHRLEDALLVTPVNDVETGSGCRGVTGAAVGSGAALELPAEGGGLLVYGEPGLELEAGGDLLPDLVDCALVLGLAVSLPFCCCLVFARLFLNHT